MNNTIPPLAGRHVTAADAVTPATQAHIAYCRECSERWGAALDMGRWNGSIRYSCGRCGLTFPDLLGSVNCCSPDPVHCEVCADPAPVRERWIFAGREWSTYHQAPFYVWHLLDDVGRVNSSWTCPVVMLTGGEL